jgi:cytochrome c biogenesis protein CcmG/thiol:disulfide interchange protein DsbE
MRISRVLVLLACAILSMPGKASAQSSSDLLHKVAPQFSRPDLNGRQINLKDYRGKVVLLNFWATWCASCQVELPRFEEWQKRYSKDGLQVLTISMDDGDAPVRKTVRKLHLALPVVMGDAKLGESYDGVLGLPVTFLIARDGTVVAKIKGETDLGALETRLRQLLNH